MAEKRDKRVYSGYYTKHDSSQIFVVIVVTDSDTDEEVVIYQDHIYAQKPEYHTMTKASFCETVTINGKTMAKFSRQALRPVGEDRELDIHQDGFFEYKRRRKPHVWPNEDDSIKHTLRHTRQNARTYWDYAKDLCENYRLDMRTYNLCVEEKRYIGVWGKDDFQKLKEDLFFLKSCRKTVLAGFGDYFKERFFEQKSIRQYAADHDLNRGSVDYLQRKFLFTLAQALEGRDKADGISRLHIPSEEDECEEIEEEDNE